MIRRSQATETVALISFVAGAIAAAALAGPLDPPAGPVAPTYKTLAEVEPRIAINVANTPGDADSLFKITQSGSYYLTGNIQGVAAKYGIEIDASGVTLDLNGFELQGVVGSLDGVNAYTGSILTNIAIINGSVRSWGGSGIYLLGANCRIADVLASNNSGHGFFANNGSTVSNCSASFNTLNGIFTASGCTVLNCSAFLNTGIGISASGGSTVTNCSAHQNTGVGIRAVACTVSACSAFQNSGGGISVFYGTTVTDCTAVGNILDGIVCSDGCVIRGNVCNSNGSGAGFGAGIHATSTQNRLEGNTCTNNDRGFDVDTVHNIIIKNTCVGNTTNWNVAAGNVILVVNGTSAPAVNGNAGGATPGSTDPNVNFSY